MANERILLIAISQRMDTTKFVFINCRTTKCSNMRNVINRDKCMKIVDYTVIKKFLISNIIHTFIQTLKSHIIYCFPILEKDKIVGYHCARHCKQICICERTILGNMFSIHWEVLSFYYTFYPVRKQSIFKQIN